MLKKTISFLIVILTLSTFKSEAQEVLDSSLVKSILKRSTKKEKRLNKLLSFGELPHKILVTYQLDEHQIEEYLSRKIQRDDSNVNYINQLILAEKRYQHLIAKYYHILSALLNEEDQSILEEAQARWHSYKRYEQAVNTMLNPEGYNMKSIPIAKLAERQLDITKFRVMELTDYIARFSKKE
ncbi:MAG: hypothetical protein V3V00_11465 [Saprospiraceae bacterium]